MSEEGEYWARLVTELQLKYTLERIAEEVGVTVRQVSNWKTGDRPTGLNAIRLREFHMKYGTTVHGAEESKA